MSLRYTAATSSKVQKSPRKKPSTNPLIRKNVKSKTPTSKTTNENDDSSTERLQVCQHNIEMDFELRGVSILQAMDKVISNQWAERTVFHDRYFSKQTKASVESQTDLLFSLRGLSMEVKADIIKYRQQQLPSAGMVTVNQLYTLFESKGNTYVDRCLELCTREGSLRKFVISNASPVISKAGKRGSSNNVTYGYENAEIVVKTEDYIPEITRCISSADPTSKDALTKFKQFVEANPTSLYVTNRDFSYPDLSLLVKKGFLTLTSNHHLEIDVHHYAIAYPRCGTFLKMINAGRSWLVKTLNKTAYKEDLEQKLFDKWEGKTMASFRKPFYGYDLLWILADAKGAGVLEGFDTPVGRGWRLTGKF